MRKVRTTLAVAAMLGSVCTLRFVNGQAIPQEEMKTLVRPGSPDRYGKIQLRKPRGSKVRPDKNAARARNTNPARTAFRDGLRLDAFSTDPIPPIKVYYDQDLPLDATTRALFVNMVNVLDGYAAVPGDRGNFFSALINSPDYIINGWQGFVTAVQPNATGNLVTVDVVPTFSSGGRHADLSSQYSEQYQVNNNGSIQYVGALDPQGMAGQFPTEILDL